MAKASDNVFPYIHLAPAAAPSAPAAGSQRLYLDSGDSNKPKLKDSAGVVTALGGSGAVKDFAQAKRTSADVTINSTTFTNVDTGLDLVMSAVTGDVIEVGLAVRCSSASLTYMVFDFHTIVSSAPVNSISTESAASTTVANSFPQWARAKTQDTTGADGGSYFGGSKRYVLQAGDISGGTVTLRLRAFSGGSVTVKATDPMLYVFATNLGPQL